MTNETLRLALDALEIAKKFVQHNHGNDSVAVPIENAIAAIDAEQAKGREAVAPVHYRAILDPAQVPHQLQKSLHVVGFRDERSANSWINERLDFDGWRYTLESLYNHPPAQPVRETAAMQKMMARLADLLDEDQFAEIESIVASAGVQPAHPAREWVGLTDVERYELFNAKKWDLVDSWEYEFALEEALREKNTGQTSSIPAELDVRKIMLTVVPGLDGEGVEVYAKNVADVERLLSDMGQRLEDYAGQPVVKEN